MDVADTQLSMAVRYETATPNLLSVYDIFWMFEFEISTISEEFKEKVGSITMEQFSDLEVPVDVMLRFSVVVYCLQKKMNLDGREFIRIPKQFYQVFHAEFPEKTIEDTIGELLEIDGYSERYENLSCRLGDMLKMGEIAEETTLKQYIKEIGFSMFEFLDLLSCASFVFAQRADLDLPVWIYAVALLIPLRNFLKENDGRNIMVSWMWLVSRKTAEPESAEQAQAEKIDAVSGLFDRVFKEITQAVADAPWYYYDPKVPGKPAWILVPEKIASPGYELDDMWMVATTVQIVDRL